jgi:hypothetical protein
MNKIEIRQGQEWASPRHHPCYTRERLDTGEDRIHGCIPDGDPSVFSEIVQSLPPPYVLLYVLHTPRGEADPGRYQSEELSREQLSDLIERHKPFLASDARFDLWGHSTTDNSTVVWDRHNQLYCYGNLSQPAGRLKERGFIEEPPPPIGPHKHFYRAEMDILATALLSYCAWSHSPLRSEDGQRPLP